MIPIVKSVSAPTSQVLKLLSGFSFTGRFRFLLLICRSPPYKYIISYGAPYINSFMLLFIKYSHQKRHLTAARCLCFRQPGYETDCRKMEELMFLFIKFHLHYIIRHVGNNRKCLHCKIYQCLTMNLGYSSASEIHFHSYFFPL